MKMPDLGEGVVEAEVVGWLVAEGDAVGTETPVAEVETDKATVEITAPVAGKVSTLLVAAGDLVAVGTDILAIAVDGDVAGAVAEGEPTEPEPLAEPLAEPQAESAPRTPGSRRPTAAPTVRRLARDLGLDLHDLEGSGPDGRILRADVLAVRADESELRGARRTSARRLTTAWQAPHITLVEEADVTELESLRELLNGQTEDALRLTPLTFIARAVVLACAEHPGCNATFDAASETLTRHEAVHLGIATQTDRGLLVPVVRDADRLSISDTTRTMRDVAELARSGKARREDLTGSTITISSLGGLGGLMSTPILNAPEVAIVAVNRMRTEPVWNGSAFVPRQVLRLSASFDHRVVDGWDAAVFVQSMKERLEHPALLTLAWAG